jgi:hypothetical protein
MTDAYGRLDDKIAIEYINATKEGLFGGKLWNVTPRILEVDKNNASFVFDITSKYKFSVGNTLTIKIPGLVTGYDYALFDVGLDFSEIDIPDTIGTLDRKGELTNFGYKNDSEYAKLKHKDLNDTIPLLVKDQTNIPIAGIDWAIISNIGYVDGMLHIQTRFTDKYKEHDPGAQGFCLLDGNGEEISYELISHGYSGVGFHEEVIYDIDRETLKTCFLKMGRTVVDETVQGPWKLQFKIESKVSSFDFTGKDVKFSVSPIGTEVQISRNQELCDTLRDRDTSYILLNDGSMIPLKLDHSEVNNDNGNGTLHFISRYYDIEQFEAIVLDDVKYRK